MKKQILLILCVLFAVSSLLAQNAIMSISNTYASDNTAKMTFILQATEADVSLEVDWGNGIRSLYSVGTDNTSIQSNPTGTITLYGDASKIKYFKLSNVSRVTSIDATAMSGLITLEATSNSNLTEIILPSVPTNLQKLTVNNNKLGSLNLDDYKSLTHINVKSNSNITSLTLPGEDNELLELDCTSLTKLESLDLRQCSKLKKLWIERIKSMSTLILPDIKTSLEYFEAYNAKFPDNVLNVSEYVNLTYLNLEYAELEALSIPSQPQSSLSIDCSSNYLHLNNLPEGNFSNLYYMPQFAKYTIAERYALDDIIDLSEWYMSKKGYGANYDESGRYPTFTWYKGEGSSKATLIENEDYVIIDNCKFRFLSIPDKEIYCEIYNAGYPNLVGNEACKTNTTLITAAEEPIMTLTNVGTTYNVGLKFAATESGTPVKINWGDGVKVEYTINSISTGNTFSSVPKATEIKVYGDASKIKLFEISSNGRYLRTADFSKASGLITLNCKGSNNSITSIVLPKETQNLKMLDVSSNNITSLDVSAYTKLETLICSSNRGLTELILPSHDNELKKIVSKYTFLNSLDVSKCSKLTTLEVGSYNNLTSTFTELILPDNVETLMSLNCQSGALSSLDISKYINLKDVDCSFNKLTSINIPENPVSDFILECSSNSLFINDLPEGRFTAYYSPQFVEYTINDTYTTNDIIDMSEWYVSKKGIGSKYLVSGRYPTFKWYTKKNSTSTPLIEEEDYLDYGNGTFKFLKVPANEVYCEVYNDGYPDLSGSATSCQTNLISITEGNTTVSNYSLQQDEINLYIKDNSIFIDTKEACKYTILSASGKIMTQGNAFKQAEIKVDFPGMYIVKIQTAGNEQSHKVLVK